jgi:hypothetical protein
MSIDTVAVTDAYKVERQDDGRALLVVSGGFAIRYASEEAANKAREALIASTLRQRAADRAKGFIA